MSCPHLAEGALVEPKPTDECPDCLAIGNADWVHLRGCLTCGHIGCCDSSPNQHATKHFEATGHPVMRSIQPGETWRWCFVDEEIG
ncbi:UBP-type zinc finger domain-containing protein [Micromonospora inositola]|uniref:Ubiquitin-hydrolase Zn-finger-containing protein n=1 Tax=Micromonospora inositola TaxID=47865 RepID=A0A1C5K0K2_9ACTN|nr:UBP-type zinc finger domain-containing protein [Micromonospora inositola]SCG76303.1 ubiquitin-hydrolase Zn-finger-containing protein [Micromonospora inositola]